MTVATKLTILAGSLVLLMSVMHINDRIEYNKLSCPSTIRINSSNLPWTPYDQTVEKLAAVRCGFKYKNSACLVRFTKLGFQNYRVICGAKR